MLYHRKRVNAIMSSSAYIRLLKYCNSSTQHIIIVSHSNSKIKECAVRH